MAYRVAVVAKTSWFGLIPSLVVMVGLMLGGWSLLDVFGLVLGFGLYLILSRLLRRTILRDFYRGLAFSKKRLYKQAIPHFDDAYAFITRHPWIDKYRSVVLLNYGRFTITEATMSNLASCYVRTGDGQKAIDMWKKMLEVFPESRIARDSLEVANVLNTAQKEQSRAESGEGEG